MRVKIVKELYSDNLEESINKALEELEKDHNEIVDIKYSIYTDQNGWGNPVTYYGAMIMYRSVPWLKPFGVSGIRSEEIYNELVKGRK